MRWSCLKRGQQSRSCHQTSSLPICVPKYAASVSNLSCLRKLGMVLTRNFIHDPFLLFSWYWVFHLHQHLSHCSEDNLQLGGSTYAFAGFFNLLWHPFTYGRHKTCTLLSSVSLSFTVSSSSLSLHSYCLGTITETSVWSGAQTLSYMWIGSGVLSGISCHMHWTLRVPENHTLNQIGGKWNYVVLPCRIYFIQCNIHCSSVLCYDRYWWSDILPLLSPFLFPLLPSFHPPFLPYFILSSSPPLLFLFPFFPSHALPSPSFSLPIYLLPFFLSPSGLNQVFPHDLPKFTTGKYHILCIIHPWAGHLSASWKRTDNNW